MFKTLLASAALVWGATAAYAENPYVGTPENLRFNTASSQSAQSTDGAPSYGITTEYGAPQIPTGLDDANHGDYVRDNVRPVWSGG